ncbi:hypothetical protein T09_2237 [Trichinella sp. T9]|nr:hypothetical protein T09_2237 [Trichinella sp. T9]
MEEKAVSKKRSVEETKLIPPCTMKKLLSRQLTGQFLVCTPVKGTMYKNQPKRFLRLREECQDLQIPYQFKTAKSGEDFESLTVVTGSRVGPTLLPHEDSLWQRWKIELTYLNDIQLPRCIVLEKQNLCSNYTSSAIRLWSRCIIENGFCGQGNYHVVGDIEVPSDSDKTSYYSKIGTVTLFTIGHDIKFDYATVRNHTHGKNGNATVGCCENSDVHGGQLSLMIDQITCWSDEKVTASWIKSPRNGCIVMGKISLNPSNNWPAPVPAATVQHKIIQRTF